MTQKTAKQVVFTHYGIEHEIEHRKFLIINISGVKYSIQFGGMSKAKLIEHINSIINGKIGV